MSSGTIQPPANDHTGGWAQGMRAFRHHNYRLYFGGLLISTIGTWMQTVAQGWLVLQLTHSPFALGVVTALQSLPMLCLALFGGVIADRMPKHRLLVYTQSASAILALILAVDVTAGTVLLWHVYALATLLGIVNAVDVPTRQAFAVEMVGKEDLMNAIALNSALFNSARIIGPAIAGVLIALVGLALCFYFNAISFVAVIIALLLMRVHELRIHGAVQHGGSVRFQLGEAFHYVGRTPVVLTVLVMGATAGMFAYNSNVILPVFADSVMHTGAAGFGIMSSAVGIGSVISATTLAFGRRVQRSVLLGGFGFFVLFALAFSWLRMFFPLSLLFLVGVGGCLMAFSTQANTAVQTATPDALRGRVMSLYMTVFQGTQPVGSFMTGALAALYSAPVAYTVNVAICGLVLVGVLLRGRWQDTPTGKLALTPTLSQTAREA